MVLDATLQPNRHIVAPKVRTYDAKVLGPNAVPIECNGDELIYRIIKCSWGRALTRSVYSNITHVHDVCVNVYLLEMLNISWKLSL